jgi:hypothetical protein
MRSRGRGGSLKRIDPGERNQAEMWRAPAMPELPLARRALVFGWTYNTPRHYCLPSLSSSWN